MIKITLKEKLLPAELEELELKLQDFLSELNYKTEIKNEYTGNEMTTPDEEFSCSKCGKTLKEGEYNDYDGLCATCWHERN